MEFSANGTPEKPGVEKEDILVMAAINVLKRDGMWATIKSIQADLDSEGIQLSEEELRLILQKLFGAGFISATEDADGSVHYTMTALGQRAIRNFVKKIYNFHMSE